jgi:threonine dehydrogenase-like Zn-dependent dehydrogenase
MDVSEIHERLESAGYAVASVRKRHGVVEVVAPDETPERRAAAQALAERDRTRPPRMGLREAELTLLLDPTHVAARALVTREVARLRAERLG